MDSRYLQIDHRVPYEVAGDKNHDEQNIGAYMLLDASSQRAKSWTCEHCRNFRDLQDAAICAGCYWAWPENYAHIAMEPTRRAELVWTGPSEVEMHSELKQEAAARSVSITDLVKAIIRDWLKRETRN